MDWHSLHLAEWGNVFGSLLVAWVAYWLRRRDRNKEKNESLTERARKAELRTMIAEAVKEATVPRGEFDRIERERLRMHGENVAAFKAVRDEMAAIKKQLEDQNTVIQSIARRARKA